MFAQIKHIKSRLFSMHRQDAEQILIDQFYTLLQTAYQRVQEDDHPEHPDHHIHAEVRHLLNQDKNWENVYHIELLLVYIMREEDLDARISRSLLDIQEVLENRYPYYQNEIKNADMSHKRAILRNIIQDIQWFYKTRDVRHIYEQQARSRVTWVFIGALLLFFLPNLVPPIADFLIEYIGGPRAYFVFAAITSGCLGATFSLLTGLREKFKISRLNDLRTMHRWSYGLLRVFIGMGAGVLFYYFIQTGLIQGEFVPKSFNATTSIHATMENMKGESREVIKTERMPKNMQDQKTGMASPTGRDRHQGEQLAYKDLALLILLCFVSGFSEKLVPDILSRTEQRMRGQTRTPPQQNE